MPLHLVAHTAEQHKGLGGVRGIVDVLIEGWGRKPLLRRELWLGARFTRKSIIRKQ